MSLTFSAAPTPAQIVGQVLGYYPVGSDDPFLEPAAVRIDLRKVDVPVDDPDAVMLWWAR